MTKHRSVYRTILLSALVIVTGIAVEATASPPAYTLTDLGNLGLGGGYTTGLDINDSGQVVGESRLNFGTYHAFLYDDGAMYDLGTLGGGGSRAYGINASGQVAGWSYTAGDAAPHAFLWTPTTPNGHTGKMQDLGTLGGTTSRAYGLNDAGQVVGESFTTNGEVHGFLYDGEMHDLGSLAGNGTAVAINASGLIVGTSLGFDGIWHVTLYDGTLHDLGAPGGTNAYATGINDRGDIVGWWESAYGDPIARSFVYENGVMRDIGSLGGTHTAARDINNNGDIVGTALTAEGLRHPFIYTSGSGMTDLNTLIDPQQLGSDELIWANAINDSGQLVAGGWNWYLLTPVPEPATFALLALGLPLLVGRHSRRSGTGGTRGAHGPMFVLLNRGPIRKNERRTR